MISDKSQYFLIGFVILIGCLIASYLSSVLFFIMSGYSPSSALPWSVWTFLNEVGKSQIQSRLFVAIGFPFLGMAVLLIKIFSKVESSLGDARWATVADIRTAGLFSKKGIILGKYKGRYLYSDTNTHVMCVAPTRSGKGIGIVIPNLLTWEDSVVCFDIKQENYERTAGFRKAHGHDVFMFAPLSSDGKSHRFNPFDEVRKDPIKRISDLEKIATILIKVPAKSDPIWAHEARALFVGLALYVLDSEEMPSTIGSIYRMLGTEQELGDVIHHIVKTHTEIDEDMKGILLNFANKAAKERSGVKSSMSQALQLWKLPEIDAVTSTSDFTLKDIRKRRMAIYIGVATGDIPTLAPLLNVFFEQLMTTLTIKRPDATEPRKVLILLDEFHMLGRMETVANVFTLAGGYNCRIIAVVQGLGWIDDVYGRQKRDGILSVCAHRVFFSANDLETARYVSEMCGDKTVETVSTSRKGSAKLDSPTKNISHRTWPLITKDQVTRLSRTSEIILTESSFPIKCHKIAYNLGNDNKIFSLRLLPPPEIPSLEIKRQKIPIFDISEEKGTAKPFIDPNQRNMFKPDKKQPPLKADLSSWIDEAVSLKAEESEHDETALIIKLLSNLSEPIEEKDSSSS